MGSENGEASTLDEVSATVAATIEPAQIRTSAFVQRHDLENRISTATEVSAGFWQPVFANQKQVWDDYWKDDDNTTYGLFQDGVSYFSLVLGRYQDWSLGRVGQLTEEDLEKYPPQIGNLLSFLIFMDKESTDQALINSTNIQLERIRHHTTNPVKKDDYKVVVKESEIEGIVNAFTSGATIYPATGSLKVLEPDEVAALLAHEVAHASLNHNVSTLFQIFGSAAGFFADLSLESINWLLTGNEKDNVVLARNEGILNAMTIRVSGIDAPKIEMEADAEGARILLRAGISPEHLKSALIKLTLAAEITDSENMDSEKKLREYPELLERLENIDRVISDNSPHLVALTASKQ